MRAYIATVRAKEGCLLLGGVKEHISSPFLLLDNALDWAETVRSINREAGRSVGGYSVTTEHVSSNKASNTPEAIY